MTRAFWAALCAGLAWTSTAIAASHCQLDELAHFPITMAGLQPLTTVKINGSDVKVVVDSGAFFSSISSGKATELNLHLDQVPDGLLIGGVGGFAQEYLTRVKSFSMAGSTIPNVQFLVGELGGGQSSGLLGQNVLHLADQEYDFTHGVVRLIKPKDCGSAPLAYWATDGNFSTLPIIKWSPQHPTAKGEAVVNGVKISVIFDTGGGQSMMTRAAAAKAGIKLNSPDVHSAGYVRGIGRRQIESWIVPIDNFKLGDAEEIAHTHLRIGDWDAAGYDMIIGADFFLSHRVLISNSQSKMYFSYVGGPVFDLSTAAKAADSSTSKMSESATNQGAEPTDAQGYARLGAAQAARNQFEVAIANFSKAIALDPADSTIFLQRARARLGNRQPLLAMGDLDQVLKLKPADTEALIIRAALRLSESDYSGAVSDIDAALAATPKASDTRLQIASLYQQARQPAKAIAQYDLWVSIHGDSSAMPVALNGRCWTRATAGQDLDKALADCDRAIRSSPKAADMLDSRALVHLRRGELDKALADYNAALAMQPKQSWSLYGRSLVEAATGKTAEAQADKTAALALNRKLPELAKAYGIVDDHEALTPPTAIGAIKH